MRRSELGSGLGNVVFWSTDLEDGAHVGDVVEDHGGGGFFGVSELRRGKWHDRLRDRDGTIGRSIEGVKEGKEGEGRGEDGKGEGE
jgi:hypothetical protein